MNMDNITGNSLNTNDFLDIDEIVGYIWKAYRTYDNVIVQV